MKKALFILIFALQAALLSAQNVYISDICITGNDVTKSYIILRELPFQSHQTLSAQKLDTLMLRAKENLLNTTLFNYVTLTLTPIRNLERGQNALFPHDSLRQQKAVVVNVNVEERWFVWPLFEIRLEDRNTTSWMKKMNWKRVTYLTGVNINNLFGVSQRLTVRGFLGWDTGVDLTYSKIALDNKRKTFLTFRSYHLLNKSVEYITTDNKVRSLSSSRYNLRSSGTQATFTWRPHHRRTYSAALGYDVSKITDTVLRENPLYWGVNSKVSRTISFNAEYVHDNRNWTCYPTEGTYFEAGLRLEESNGFDFSYAQATAEFQYLKKLSNRWFVSTSLRGATSLYSNYSYIHTKAIGYNTANVTGYELYVIDGQSFITQNNSIKFLILPQKVVKLGFIPKWDKFNKPFFTIYGKLMFDWGYVWQNRKELNNSYSNSLLMGVGACADIVSYYDIILSLGYGVNNHGKGTFLFGFRAPIF
ncbi:MAG: hypothetical protein IKS79_01360 [Bacteroidales bacterium]|nr:hypothetical protein [Bacteroidales bacterium]